MMPRQIVLIVVLLVWGWMPVQGQATTCPDDIRPENEMLCVSLFDQSLVTIKETIYSEQALFLNPQVTISLSIKGDGETVRIYIPSHPGWEVITPEGGKCPLMVVGIAGPNDTQPNWTYEDLPANGTLLTRGLYTFCARSEYTNLPRDPRIDPNAPSEIGFPKGEFHYTVSLMERPTDQLQNVIERAREGSCSGSSGALTWRSFATQLAVFIALNPGADSLTTWQLYAQQMQNISFQDDYTGIYCLLDKDAPQPAAILSADKLAGDAPLEVAFDNASTGDIQGYAFEIVNSQNTPLYSATRAAYPEATLQPYRFEQPGRYQAHLTAFGPTQSYQNGSVIPQPVSTAIVNIDVSEPPTATNGAAATTAPSPTATTIPAFAQMMQDQPFSSVPDLTVQNVLLLFVGAIVAIVALFVLLSGEMRGILLQNRRWLVVILAFALIVLGIVLWLRQPVSDAAAATPTAGLTLSPASDGAKTAAVNLTALAQPTAGITPTPAFTATQVIQETGS